MLRTSLFHFMALPAALAFSVVASSGCLFFATADAGPNDGGAVDAGRVDGGNVDGGQADGGEVDGGFSDGGIGDDAGVFDGGDVDGGLLDGGDVDGGLLDGGNVDGGVPDGGIIFPSDGGPVRVDWFHADSPFRIGVKLTAIDASLAADDPLRIAIDHAALVTAGARANGSDLFVVFDDSSNGASIVSHRLTAGGSFNASDTELMIRLEAPIPLGGSDNRYSIYFGGNPPSLPLPTVSTSRVFSYASGNELWNTSDPDIDTGSEAATGFTAYAGDEWMFAASWRQRTTGPSQDPDEEFCSVVRVSINGTPYIDGATATQFREGWRMMGVIGKFPSIETGFRNHFLELNLLEGEAQGTGQLQDVRIVAFQLIGGAFAGSARLPASPFSSNTELAKVEFEGFAPQPLLFAGSAIREGPTNTGGTGLRVFIGENSLVQSTRESKIGSAYFKPMFHAQRVPSEVGGSVPTQATVNVLPAGPPGNTVMATSIVAADASRYAEVSSVSGIAPIIAISQTSAPILSLSLPQSNLRRQRVTIVTAAQNYALNGAEHFPEPGLRITVADTNGTLTLVDELADNRDVNEWSNAAFVMADRSGSAVDLAMTASLGELGESNGVRLTVRHAHAVSFSYPLATVESGPIEDFNGE